MKLSDLKGQGIADRLTGTYFANTPHLDKFTKVSASIREADADEARRESALPQWSVTVGEGVFVRKFLRRAWSAPMLLEAIAAELMRDEDERDEVVEQISVTIERAK